MSQTSLPALSSFEGETELNLGSPEPNIIELCSTFQALCAQPLVAAQNPSQQMHQERGQLSALLLSLQHLGLSSPRDWQT